MRRALQRRCSGADGSAALRLLRSSIDPLTVILSALSILAVPVFGTLVIMAAVGLFEFYYQGNKF